MTGTHDERVLGDLLRQRSRQNQTAQDRGAEVLTILREQCADQDIAFGEALEESWVRAMTRRRPT
jgi:hypothetical protein